MIIAMPPTASGAATGSPWRAPDVCARTAIVHTGLPRIPGPAPKVSPLRDEDLAPVVIAVNFAPRHRRFFHSSGSIGSIVLVR
jgi:hypothetical protein